MPAVCVVIPAYNEAATIAAVAGRALAQLPDVIVVDDGSTDGTSAQLAGLPVTLLQHPDNRGKAASLWRGMEYALQQGAQWVITLDGDGQHNPEDIPRLLAVAVEQPQAIVMAARLRERANVPKARRFANGMADFWISWTAGYPIRDSQSGFRCYPAELLRQLRLPCDRRHGFVFESEILIVAARRGFWAVPVVIAALYPPQARASHYRPALDTARIVRMVAWKLLSRGLYPVGLLRSLGWWPMTPKSFIKGEKT